MKTMNDYLAALSKAESIPSDRQLAKYLGVTKQTVSAYRNRGVTVSPDTAWKIADALGIDPAEIIATAELERARRANDPEKIGVWRKRLASVGASLCAAFIGVFLVFASPGPANAGAHQQDTKLSSVYIMLNL